MTFEDCRGLAVTADSAEAVQHIDATVAAYLGLRRDTGEHLKQTLTADPALLLAQCARGYFMLLFCTPRLLPKAAESLEAARAARTARGATAREALHIDALDAWHAGDLPRAIGCFDAILLDHPTDLLAMRLAHFHLFYAGAMEEMRDSVARCLHAWDDDRPGYGFVLGMHAFGQEETGDYAAGERTGRAAVERNPEDIWAAHAVAHVMEMQGRQADGVDWITGLQDHWGAVNNFANHVWWHRCLYLYELGRFDETMARYDAEVRAQDSDEYLDLVNAASLLWRLEEAGVEVGDRWAELGAKAEARVEDHFLVFLDAHYAMALAAAGRTEQVAHLIETMGEVAGEAEVSQAPVMASIGLPLCAALFAFRNGDYGRAVDLLLPIRYAIRNIGGSHAQRDVFQQTLIAAALADGRFGLARALLSERVRLRPNSAWSWQRYARALDGLGDTAAAADARHRADALLAA
jgi:tetratricopeptide (TPR) repeat protein